MSIILECGVNETKSEINHFFKFIKIKWQNLENSFFC